MGRRDGHRRSVEGPHTAASIGRKGDVQFQGLNSVRARDAKEVRDSESRREKERNIGSKRSKFEVDPMRSYFTKRYPIIEVEAKIKLFT